jgi:hypothetical protein
MAALRTTIPLPNGKAVKVTMGGPIVKAGKVTAPIRLAVVSRCRTCGEGWAEEINGRFVAFTQDEADAAIEALEASLAVGWGSDNEAESSPGIAAFKSALAKVRDSTHD